MISKLLPVIATACLCIVSCNKLRNEENSVINDHYTTASVFMEVAIPSKTVTIDATTGGTFNGNSGTRYIFPPSAFKDAAGGIVTGTVQVEVTEYLKKSDMLFSGVLPVSGNQPLLSGGEINVKATQGGQSLQMAAGKTFTANMPMKGTSAAGMTLFTGTQQPNSTQVNWEPVVDSAAGIVVLGGDTISMISPSLDFCNADKFMVNPDFQKFTISVVGPNITFSDDSISCYTLYDDYNGVWGSYNPTKGMYREYTVPSIPVHFAVMAIKNGNFYGGVLAATPVTGSNYTVPVSKTTPSAFKKELEKL